MKNIPSDKTLAERRTRILLVLGCLLLPTLSLVPFGSVWLWQQGYLVYWAIGAALTVLAGFWLQRRLLPPGVRPSAEAVDADDAAQLARKLNWSPLEEQAMSDVNDLATRVNLDELGDWDAVLALGRKTIETVAHRLHPSRRDPVWQFTPPEALAIVERVSRRLRSLTVEKVPFGDRMTVAQMLTLYRWRGAVDYAEKAWDLWRILRVANPVTAATHEVRERLSGELIQWGRNEVARRIIEAYVREVGRAAIDLYGGRLRIAASSLGEFVSDDSAADTASMGSSRAEPLRILVAGQVSAGKSSLVNALAEEAKAAIDALPATATFTAYALQKEGLPAALLIDSPGLASDARATAAMIDKAADCDLVLWVVPAHKADRHIDKLALDAFRQHFATRLNRRRPPVLLVLTHIDQLRPFGEWSPPYDLAAGNTPKAESIRAALAAAAGDLGFAPAELTPVSLRPGANYNVEALWQQIASTLPEATRAQLLRCLSDLKDDWRWSSLWKQTSNASRAIAGSLKKQLGGETQ